MIMAGLAVPLGGLLRSMPPLRAYSIDIAGSMTGIALFTLLSASGTPPIVWFSVVAVLRLAARSRCRADARLDRDRRLARGGPRAGRACGTPAGQIWSPYYRIDEYHSNGIGAINVNGIPHQAMWPLDRQMDPFYEQVYRWFPERTYDNVLIVGAGSGTDVAVALKHGARHVDAVEIDARSRRSASAIIRTSRTTTRASRGSTTTAGRSCAGRPTTTTSWCSHCPTR